MDHLVDHGVDLFQAVCQRDPGGNSPQGGTGAVSAGDNNLSEDQEPKLLASCGPQRLFRCSPKTWVSIWKDSAPPWRECRMKTDARCRVSMIGKDDEEETEADSLSEARTWGPILSS